MEPPPRECSGAGELNWKEASKEEIRLLVYKRLREVNAARPPFPIEHRIPNFKGAEEACRRILELSEWREARIVKVNPDSPQRYIRYRALTDGKILLMPTPRLRRGFLLLDPSIIPARSHRAASTIKGAFKHGLLLNTISDLEKHVNKIDFIVEGSVAVSIHGDRLGKGHGYGDVEWGILAEMGLVSEETPIATSVHDIQVFESRLPQGPHDVPIDYIATPTRLIRVKNRRGKPHGILWSMLEEGKLEEIPLLRELSEVKA